MLNYALIGLGGALGSMARAWVAIAMARMTGPTFPWGTILINITGSFLIGFVGSLTATDGRLTGVVELRTFLMIGFCGGYTTFSSFSLQTLDLLRDGRGGQALGNVALSVALCLGAVAVGHVTGSALRPGRETAERVPAGLGPAGTARAGMAPAGTARAGTAPADMPPADRGLGVLAVLDRAATARAVLDAASRWRALAGGGPVRALAVHAAPATSFLPSEEVLTAERAAELAAARRDHIDVLHAAFTTWRRDQPTPAGAAPAGPTWSEVAGHPAAAVVAHGREAAAIVLANPRPHDPPAGREALHAALFDTAVPVLLLPSEPAPAAAFGHVVAIAWRAGDPRAEAAVRAALPLLRQADRVAVLVAGNRPPTLPPALRDAGVPAQTVPVPRGEGPVGASLLAAAEAQSADLLVMGAFTHGPWHEAVLGGVTRHVLTHAHLPLLLRH